MFDLTCSQKKDFLEGVGKVFLKNSEELDSERIEAYLQMRVTRSPEFREKIDKLCQKYKRANKIGQTGL